MKVNNTSVTTGIHGIRVPSSGGFINPWAVNYQANGTRINANDTLMCTPFIPAKTFSISGFSINVTTAVASSVARVLFYSDVNGLPNTKLYESTNIDCSSIGLKLVSQNFTFNAGTTYWLATQNSLGHALSSYVATQVAYTFANSVIGWPTNPICMYQFTYAIGSAPTTLPSGTGQVVQPQIIQLHVS